MKRLLKYTGRGLVCLVGGAITFDLTRRLMFPGDVGFWSLFVPVMLGLFVAVAGAVRARPPIIPPRNWRP